MIIIRSSSNLKRYHSPVSRRIIPLSLFCKPGSEAPGWFAEVVLEAESGAEKRMQIPWG